MSRLSIIYFAHLVSSPQQYIVRYANRYGLLTLHCVVTKQICSVFILFYLIKVIKTVKVLNATLLQNLQQYCFQKHQLVLLSQYCSRNKSNEECPSCFLLHVCLTGEPNRFVPLRVCGASISLTLCLLAIHVTVPQNTRKTAPLFPNILLAFSGHPGRHRIVLACLASV